LILDKGLVIDAYVRVSVVGIELITIDARIVVASVDTYLRFAEAVNRLDLAQEKAGLPDLVEGGSKEISKGKVGDVKEKPKRAIRGAEEKTRDAAKELKRRVPGGVGKR
jgi:hypothetical protein